MTNRERYRTNADYRAKALARMRKYRARKNEIEKYRDYVHKRIYALRQSLAFYLTKVEFLERELLSRTQEVREINTKLSDGHTTLRKAGIRRRPPRKALRLSTGKADPPRLRELYIPFPS